MRGVRWALRARNAGATPAGGDGAPARHLDVKFYPRAALPTAVTYFVGDAAFMRALRQWARASPAAWVAAAAATGGRADSYHLADTALTPTRRRSEAVHAAVAAGRPARGGVRHHHEEGVHVGGPVEVACETDVFEALGLSYVPPHLRSFDI